MSAVYQYKSLATTFKEVDRQTMTVAGYFSAFDKVDAYNEVTERGAFKKTVSENFDRIRFLLNHDVTKSLGPIEELTEDDYGLFYRAKVLPTSFGQDFMIMVDGGIIKEHSIGYREIKGRDENGIHFVQEVKLYEGSALTGWGVNQYTPLTAVMKATEIEGRIKSLETFCRNTTASDETIQLLLLEIKQLNQAILDIKATEPKPITQPEAKGIDTDLVSAYISLLN